MLRRKPYIIPTAPEKGLDVSYVPLFLDDKAMPYMRNVRVDRGVVKRNSGMTAFGSNLPLTGTPMFFTKFVVESGATHWLLGTTDFVYEYMPDTNEFENKSKKVTTGAIEITFEAATKKIIRSSGSFVTDGFTEGTIVTTNSSNNPGPFTVTSVSALELVVSETVVDEGPATFTIDGRVPFTGDEDDAFDWTVMPDSAGNDIFILTNGVDPIMKWDGAQEGFEELGGWSNENIKARTLAVHSSRLIAGYTIESGTGSPRRVRWSVAGNPEDVTGTGSGFVDLAETGDHVTKLAIIQSRLYAFKEQSIWEIAYVGGTTYFTPELRVQNVGCEAPRSLAQLGNEVVFFGTDNVYQFDGLNLYPIADMVRHMLYHPDYKSISTDKPRRIHGWYYQPLNVYGLAFPLDGDHAELVLEYDFKGRFWTMNRRETTMVGVYTAQRSIIWRSLIGTWGEQDGTWEMDPEPIEIPVLIIGQSDGNIYEDDKLTSSGDSMFFETKEWAFDNAQRWLELEFLAKGGDFEVSYSIDGGETWSEWETLSAPLSKFDQCKLFVNKTSLTLRARVRASADVEIKWISPWYIERMRGV